MAVRLRLGLTDLAAVEQWAGQAISEGGADHDELTDLGIAKEAGERITLRLLSQLGGKTTALDVMRAFGPVRVDELSPEELSRLAHALDPVLEELDANSVPDVLDTAFDLAEDFHAARAKGDVAVATIEKKMRAMLHDVKEYAAELPEEKQPEEAPPPAPTVSAVVVSYNTGPVLFDCLAALHGDKAIDEIVLVNNGNPVETLERVDQLYGRSDRLKVVGGGANRGFAAGVNFGAARAKGDRLLVINPDAVLQPGSVEALAAALSGAAEPAVVGGRIFGSDGKEQRGARRRRLTMRSAAATFLGLGWLKAINPGFVSINRNEEPEPAGPVPMDAVSGALMFVSRSSFDRLGGFDEGYFLHVEDLDLCRRAEAEGGTVIYTPLASALHHGATSDAPALVVEKHKGAGLNRYFRKFAETPAEKFAAQMLGPLIGFLLSMRARMRRS
ncbi:MAG: glycosyltransferase family 2 protein [Hyphomonadaceae bacterium]